MTVTFEKFEKDDYTSVQVKEQMKSDLDKNRKLILTRHCIDRATQFKLSITGLIDMFWDSKLESRPPGAKKDRRGRKTIFLRNGTYVMVAGEVVDNRSKENSYLLLTIYDQRLDLPADCF